MGSNCNCEEYISSTAVRNEDRQAGSRLSKQFIKKKYCGEVDTTLLYVYGSIHSESICTHSAVMALSRSTCPLAYKSKKVLTIAPIGVHRK